MDLNPYTGMFDVAPPSPAVAQAALLRGRPVPAPPNPLLQQYADLQRQQAEANAARERAYEAPDRSGMEQAYQQQVRGGGDKMMLALAAGEAGKQMQPFQAQFLKQASEARGPMKMAGGTMTDTGFIEDPTYKQNLAIQRADAKSQQIERALQGNISEQSRGELQRELRASQQEFQREMQKSQQAAAAALAGQASADRRYLGELSASTSRENAKDRAAAAGKVPKMTANDDKEITQALQGLASVDSAMEAVKRAPDAFGRMKGAVDYLPSVLGQAAMSERDKTLTPEQRMARTKVYNDVSAIITQRAGTAQSASEQKRLNSFLPGPTDSADVILDKLKAYREYVEEQGHAVEGKYVDMPSRLPPRAAPPAPAAPVAPAGGKRMRFNPATGDLE